MLQIVTGQISKDGEQVSANGVTVDATAANGCPSSGVFACEKVDTGKYQIFFPKGTFAHQPCVVVTPSVGDLTDDPNRTGNPRFPTVTYLDDSEGCWRCTVAFKNKDGNNKNSAFFFTATGNVGTTDSVAIYVVWNENDENDDTLSLVNADGTAATSVDCTAAMTMEFIAATIGDTGEVEASTDFHITAIQGLPWKVFGFPKAIKENTSGTDDTNGTDDAGFSWTCFNNCFETESYGFVVCAVKGNKSACTTDPQINNVVDG